MCESLKLSVVDRRALCCPISSIMVYYRALYYLFYVKNIDDYMSDAVIAAMRDAIADAKGREVFFIGTPDEKQVIQNVRVVARGTSNAVAAVTRQAKPGDVAIHNHPGGSLEPSDADVEISSIAACAGVASIIVNNDVTACYVLVEPMPPRSVTPLSLPHLTAVLATDGPMAAVVPHYEARPAQQEMMAEVARAFNDNAIAVIEAGTGTGKTIAYLIPAVIWALKNEERVVISTHTINLQEQLLHKDIPLVQQVIPKPFKATLVKGRNNYVCLRKVHVAEEEQELFADEDAAELSALIEWACKSNTGDKAELPFSPRAHVWERVHSTGETCFKARCPNYTECFVMKARREAAHAHILVTNHALLFSDIKLRQENENNESTILPDFRHVICDEAHNLEDVATRHFGSEASRHVFLRTLNMLYRIKGDEGGALSQLSRNLYRARGNCNEKEGTDVDACVEEIQRIVAEELPAVRYAVEDGFAALADILSEVTDEPGRAVQYRVTPARRKEDIWQRSATILREINAVTTKCVTALTQMLARVRNLPIENEKVAGAALDVAAQTGWLYSYAQTLDGIISDESDAYVNWLEAQVRDTYIHVSVQRAPLDITQAMIRGLYTQFATLILTSATLTSRNSFDFVLSRIGVNAYKKLLGRVIDDQTYPARPVREVILPTHFDYAANALMLLPDDVSDRFARFGKAQETDDVPMPDALLRLLRVTDGAAFVLFTSYGTMYRMADELKEHLVADNMSLFVQGTMQRDELLRAFRRTPRAVLFGTDSFWAGVDVVGEALMHVIITKLPFSVPSEPVIEARAEYIKNNGGNPFIDYAIPMAVLKFRQGFGRLIRSVNDYGIVSVLDRRIVKQRYGKWFLSSVPSAQHVRGSCEDVCAVAQKFIASHRARMAENKE